jgi:hypothetical protein
VYLLAYSAAILVIDPSDSLAASFLALKPGPIALLNQLWNYTTTSEPPPYNKIVLVEFNTLRWYSCHSGYTP